MTFSPLSVTCHAFFCLCTYLSVYLHPSTLHPFTQEMCAEGYRTQTYGYQMGKRAGGGINQGSESKYTPPRVKYITSKGLLHSTRNHNWSASCDKPQWKRI